MRNEDAEVVLAMPEAKSSVSAKIDVTEGHDGMVDEDLLARLRRTRRDLAKASDVPAYVVAPNRTLVGIAAARPTSLDALAQIHGMGQQRLTRYGSSFVDVVRNWTG